MFHICEFIKAEVINITLHHCPIDYIVHKKESYILSGEKLKAYRKQDHKPTIDAGEVLKIKKGTS